MSKRSKGWTHPIIIYLLLLMIVILASWIGTIIEMRRVGANNELVLRSVLDSAGIRWAVKSAVLSLQYAPMGNAIILFMAFGAGRGSGLFRAISNLHNLSPKERNAFIISMVVLSLYVCLIILGVFAGGHLLLSVTGSWYGSSLSKGIMFLVMLAVCLPSLVYGLSTKTFRTACDCITAFCLPLPTFAQFVVTMLIASQLLQTLQYTHIDHLLGLTDNGIRILSLLIYWLPLPILLFQNQKREDGV